MEEELEAIAKKLRNQKAKEWRDKNKDKLKEINHRYWINRAKKYLQEQKKKELND